LSNAPSRSVSDFNKGQFHAIITADWRIMRILQNSSAFCDVRRVISAYDQDRELQEAARSVRRNPGVRCAQMVKVRAAPGEVEETIPASCPDNNVQV
jgi:hypothetical protein